MMYTGYPLQGVSLTLLIEISSASFAKMNFLDLIKRINYGGGVGRSLQKISDDESGYPLQGVSLR